MDFRSIVAAALLLAAGSAQAATTIFSDDFNSSVSGLNVVPTGWTVTDGTVDVVSGSFCLTGFCVDLDGSTSNAGILSRNISLMGGLTYTLGFDLSGNKRGGTDNVTVTFGSASTTFTALASNAPYTRFTLDLTPASDGLYAINFANAGGDNVGALLENVTVMSADIVPGIPEPSTTMLLLAGLASLGIAARRQTRR
jgi:hypothetical protein